MTTRTTIYVPFDQNELAKMHVGRELHAHLEQAQAACIAKVRADTDCDLSTLILLGHAELMASTRGLLLTVRSAEHVEGLDMAAGRLSSEYPTSLVEYKEVIEGSDEGAVWETFRAGATVTQLQTRPVPIHFDSLILDLGTAVNDSEHDPDALRVAAEKLLQAVNG